MRKSCIINFLSFVFLISLSFSNYDFDFLSIPPGVRTSGAGGNFVSMYNTSEGLFYNPAVGVFCSNYEASLAYQIYLLESKIQQLSLVFPLGKIGLGLTGKMFSTSDIPIIRNYQNLGNFTMTSFLINNSLSFKILKNLSFGLGVKYVNEKIYNQEDNFILYDTGFIFKISDDIFSIAFSLENYNFSQKYSIPTNYNIGTKLTLIMPQQETEFNLLTSAKIDYKTNKIIYNFGIEHWGSNVLGLRAGYIYDQDKINLGIYDNLSFFTAGLSLRIGNFGIDYAYLPNSVLATTHNIGFYFKFASATKKEKPIINLQAKLIVEPYYFSPNGDGYLDNVFFRHNVSTFTNITLLNYIIKDDKNQVVKVIKSTGVRNMIESFYTYDGKDYSGEILKDGKYSIEFVLEDDKKEEVIVYSSQKEFFVVDTTPSVVKIQLSTTTFSPDADGNNDNIEFKLYIKDENPIETLNVSILTVDNKKVYTYKAIELQALQKDLELNFLWDGKDEIYKKVVPNGEYKIVCSVKDKAGNRSVKEEKFSVYIELKQPQKIVEKVVEKEEVLFYIEKAKVILDKRGIVVIYPTDDLFVKGTTEINPDMKQSLNSLGEIIKTKFQDRKIIIEGHTDSVGNDKENKEKSSKYAWAVYSYLVKEIGLQKDFLEAKGCGEERPVASNKSKYGRAQNRRIEIILGR